LSETERFDFGAESVAHGYETLLVPVLFEPWAIALLEAHRPWEGRRVLDLACGTGVVSRLLAGRVGSGGRVVGADVNAEMLSLARQRCAGLVPAVEFVQCAADSLEVASGSFDAVVSQQGFQFFPDKAVAAREAFRVLADGGRVVATTWCPVSECEFFGAVCKALEAIGELGISEMMRVPFDRMPAAELTAHLEAAGFADVRCRRRERELVMSGGLGHAISFAYATPIGPMLRDLPEDRQAEFQDGLATLLGGLRRDGVTMGWMVSNEISARKRTLVEEE
jgi:SAM-dependent methyltransferase